MRRSSLFLLVFMSHYQLSKLLSISLFKREKLKLLTVKTGKNTTRRHFDFGGESRLDVHSMAPLSEGHSVFFSASYTSTLRASQLSLVLFSIPFVTQTTYSVLPTKQASKVRTTEYKVSLSLSSSSQLSTEQNMLDIK